MRARRFLAATGIAAAGVVSFAAGASANDFNVTTCGTGGYPSNVLGVNVGLYGEHAPNTITVTVHGVVVADHVAFTDGYSHTFPVSEGDGWSVDLATSKGGGEQHRTGTIHCTQETTTSPASTTTPPTSPPSTALPSTVAASTSSPAVTVPSTEPNATTIPAPPASSSSSPAVVTVTSSPATGTVAGPAPHSGEDETTTPGVLIHVERDTSDTTPATLPATGSQLIGRLIGLGILLLILGGSLVMIGICNSSARSDRGES